MILPIIAALSSGVVVKKMKVTQVFSSRFNDLWEEWELRGVVFVSLTLQILLICLGNRRKYIRFASFWGVIWLFYLMADPVAIYALGIITNKLTKLNSQSVDATTELHAFWAPFLLLHLGGPDTITAYALEDNELWLRHFLSLVTQTVVTFYIFLMAWTGPNISILTIVMIFAGLVKYGERVYVLWAASSEQFRDSIPDPPPNYSKILDQQKLMEAEGYDVVPHEVIEVRDVIVENKVDGADLSSQEKNLNREQLYKRKQGELLAARGLVNIFQRLFADLLLSFEDHDTSKSVLKGKNFLAAFNIIEIELGIMYDLLYTKAKAIHTKWGFARRITGLVLICIVLVLFIRIKDQHYSVADLYLTFILLAVAIILEIYALAVLLFSDKTACWLIKEKKFAIVLDVINWLQPLTKRRRWSDHIAQYSLLSFAIKEKHLPCHQILEFLHIDEKVEKLFYKHHKKVTDDLKKLIMSQLTEMQPQGTTRGSRVLEKFNEMGKNLKWSIELEFDQSILIWHIATELCYHSKNKYCIKSMEMSECLSQYMLYILVMYPMMLPTGIGRIKFRETYIEAMKLFDEFKSNKASEDTEDKAPSNDRENIRGYKKYVMKCAGFCAGAWRHINNWKKRKLDITSACNQLRNQVKTKVILTVAKGDRSKYVLFHGCRLASQLDEIEKREDRWKLISEVWVEMLCYAASNCKGSYHAQQLRRGGELLTHVWLMMAHFGLTDNFQIPHAPAIAELIVQ
ncbi:uncharacterized protein LOC130139953 [Syzygium oleosum]|uniref:uncharacterized protein LOC130139953 n=1 Tax=Syzygium oleosum TaxID=219896 RepID=UPI0024BA7037|nr:uncharacterized protein LOC130139953 [Syzygium oleosum]